MRVVLVSVLMVAGVLTGGRAFAAQVTEVADAVDGDDPFDANLEVKLDLTRHSALITRENVQPPKDDPQGEPRTVDAKELDFERVTFRIRPRLEVGLFHDLSLFAEWPIVIWDQQRLGYTTSTDATNSTFARDQAPNPSPGVDSWDETAGAGNTKPAIQEGAYGFPKKPYNSWRFHHDDDGSFSGYRQGFDNPTFGVRFSPINNDRDDTKPTITLQADFTPSFFPSMDPTADTVEKQADPGPVADGAHRFHFSVAMSKRYLILDPYVVADYGLPLAASSGGSVTGFQPRHVGGLTIGTEIIPYEDKALDQKFAIDVNAFATYHSEGRDYSEVSDVLQEMTYTDQWVRTGVHMGLFFRAFQYFFFDVTGELAYDSEHLLTIEDFGQDGGDAGSDVNVDKVEERNPFYNPALDTVGRRVRIEQSLILGVLVHAGITF